MPKLVHHQRILIAFGAALALSSVSLASSFATTPSILSTTSRATTKRAALLPLLAFSQQSLAATEGNKNNDFACRMNKLQRTRGGSDDVRKGQKEGEGLLNAYLNALDTKPLFTKSWSSGLIACLGDLLSQVVLSKGPVMINYERLAIFSIMAAMYAGPVVHYWFGFLDRLVKKPAIAKRLPKNKLAPVLFQLSIDQTFGAAVLNSGFLVSLWLAQALVAGTLFPLGGSTGTVGHITRKLQCEFWPMLMANYKIWPLANLINFSLIPLKFRVLFSNVVAVLWNMYLSVASNR